MSGKIVFVGVKPKHALEKLIRREVDRWITNERRPPEDISYEVIICSEGQERFFYCRVQAEIGECRFVAHEGAKTPLEALTKTLKHARVQRARPSSALQSAAGMATVA